MDIVKDHGDEELYDKLDSAYATEDEHYEVCISSDAPAVLSFSFKVVYPCPYLVLIF